jgi:mono/diheme cytochrome c family protein
MINMKWFKFRQLMLVSLLVINSSWGQNLNLTQEGAKTYQQNCAACHGAQMKNPQWGFDLGKFPRDSKIRFFDSVTYGKNAMPPWEDVLSQDQIEGLWAYLQSMPPSP